MPLPSWTNAQILAQLNSGYLWSGSTITYTFPTAVSGIYTGGGEGGFSALSTNAQNAAKLALSLWDDLIAPDMTQVAPGANQSATNIEFGMGAAGVGYALAYFPTVGSVWFDPDATGGNSLTNPTIGRHGFATYIHEIGHALGLEHMGDYHSSNTPSSFQDSTVYSIMSYYGPSWGNTAAAGLNDVAWADWVGSNGVLYSPQTAMLNDIMAIQAMYGVETTTRVGDTVYGFNSNITGTSASIFDFSLNATPILTIFDSSGIDTLDVSGWTGASSINLVSGGFSSGNSMTHNIAIAYTATIENAVTGNGNDTINGNDVANRLDGGAGNDTINGANGDDIILAGSGNDAINGGAGEDTLLFSGSFGQYSFTYNAGTSTLTFTSTADGVDAITAIEFFQFTNITYSLEQLLGPTPVASIAVDTATVVEGDIGTVAVTFTVTLDMASNSAQTLNWAVANGTTSVYDFSGALSGSIQFSSGETSKTITVLVASDAFAESDETFSVQITRQTTGVVIAAGAGSATATISNDDGSIPSDDFGGTISGVVGLVAVDGSAVGGALENAYDEDMFRVDLQTGSTYLLKVSGTAGAFAGSVTLYNAAGSAVATATSAVGGLVELNYLPPSAGNYFLKVSNTLGEPARYDVEIDKLPANIINGTSTANTLIGTATDDVISGLAANDMLRGLDGNDVLDGGTGNDIMYGGLGDDTFVIDSTSDRVSELANQGTDTVETAGAIYTLANHVENLRYTGASTFKGTGNSLANEITGGVLGDTLNGGAGADRMIGLAGDDNYFIDNPGDVVVEAANQGLDTITSTISIVALADFVENLVLSGSAAVAATGNASDNQITGSTAANTLFGLGGADRLLGGSGADTLNGGEGSDILIGGTGKDLLTGGIGADTFTFLTITEAGKSTAADSITDFEVGLDHIDLSTIDASTRATGDQAFAFIGAGPFTAAGQLRFDAVTSTLYGDVNGDKVADFAIVMPNISSLSADDFIL